MGYRLVIAGLVAGCVAAIAFAEAPEAASGFRPDDRDGRDTTTKVETPSPEPMRDRAIEGAMKAMGRLARQAQSDPACPVYHFVSPGGRLGDMNGPIWYHGYYHIFYQLFPKHDQDYHPDARQHWGHARSADLVHWEQLPIAIWPSVEQGEDKCFSGTQTINGRNQPMIFYSSMGHQDGQVWAAAPEDDGLIKWHKIDENPVLVCNQQTHRGLVLSEWRDPFIFEVRNQKYMIMGGGKKHFPITKVDDGDTYHWELAETVGPDNPGEDAVPLYRAENDALTSWKFIGFLFDNPHDEVINHDCPLFFEVDGKWVLALGEHTGENKRLGSRATYYVGTLDEKKMRFEPEFRGRFYAGWGPNVLRDGQDRWIMWSFLGGFRNPQGWRNCMTLPRVLSILPDGRLGQEPAPELRMLRGQTIEFPEMALHDEANTLKGVEGDALEILAEFDLGTADHCGIRLRSSQNGKGGRAVDFCDLRRKCRDANLVGDTDRIRAHIFLDKSLVEIYVNGRSNHAAIVTARPEDRCVTVFSQGGSARLVSLKAWNLRSIWQDRDAGGVPPGIGKTAEFIHPLQ